MKRIKANDSDHVFAHVLGRGTIEIVRQKQKFVISGSDFMIIGTTPDGKEKMVVNVEDGVLVEEDLKFKETPELTDEEKLAQEEAQRKAEEESETEEDAIDPDKKKKTDDEEVEEEES